MAKPTVKRLDEVIQLTKQALENVNPDKRVCTEFRFTVEQVKQLLKWLEDYKRLQSVSSWISCSEKLPEVDKPVLIYEPYNKEMVVASLDCDKTGFSNDEYWYGLKNVPFWMSLPEPPKGD